MKFIAYKTIGIFWAMFNNQCDLGLSNIPGPTKKIVFGEDMTVESIIENLS